MSLVRSLLPQPPSDRYGSYRGVSGRHYRWNTTGEFDPSRTLPKACYRGRAFVSYRVLGEETGVSTKAFPSRAHVELALILVRDAKPEALVEPRGWISFHYAERQDSTGSHCLLDQGS